MYLSVAEIITYELNELVWQFEASILKKHSQFYLTYM